MVDYVLQFDDGFPVLCMSVGTTLAWAVGDAVWLETQVLGSFVNGEVAMISGLFRHHAADAAFDVLIAGVQGDSTMLDTRADLARLGLTLTYEPVCPFVPWPAFGSDEVPFFGREVAFTFTNGAGDTLTLRRAKRGDIALSDGRVAHIDLETAREYVHRPGDESPFLLHQFLLTIAP